MQDISCTNVLLPDSEKLSSKNRPTVFLRHNDTLSKVDPKLLLQIETGFNSLVTNLTQPRTINSVAEFTHYLKYDALDNSTVIYFDKDQSHVDLVLRFLTHKSKHPVLRVSDEQLAT